MVNCLLAPSSLLLSVRDLSKKLVYDPLEDEAQQVSTIRDVRALTLHCALVFDFLTPK